MDAELQCWKSAGQYFDYLGFEIFYRHEGIGPNLLLVHGYPFNSWDWALIWPTLIERFTVIAPDMLGMGFSAKPVALRVLGARPRRYARGATGPPGRRDGATSWPTTSAITSSRRCWRATSSVSSPMACWASSRSPGSTAECSSRPTRRGPSRRYARTPLGDIAEPAQSSSLSRRLLEPTINELFGPDTKPSRRAAGAVSARSSSTTTADA